MGWKERLSPGQKRTLKKVHQAGTRWLHAPRCRWNRHVRKSALLSRRPQLHLGCDINHLDEFVNVDVRPTRGVDIAYPCVDLKIFPTASVDLVFSQMFFEHVFHDSRPILLSEAHRVLRPGGRLLFAGVPDFESIARAYLERRRPGFVSEEFDLHEVYRQTHGDPESQPGWWLAQLHKTLFDYRTAATLLRQAGFQSGAVFRHANETDPYPLCLGLFGVRSDEPTLASVQDIQETLARCPGIALPESVEILEDLAGPESSAAETAARR